MKCIDFDVSFFHKNIEFVSLICKLGNTLDKPKMFKCLLALWSNEDTKVIDFGMKRLFKLDKNGIIEFMLFKQKGNTLLTIENNNVQILRKLCDEYLFEETVIKAVSIPNGNNVNAIFLVFDFTSFWLSQKIFVSFLVSFNQIT